MKATNAGVLLLAVLPFAEASGGSSPVSKVLQLLDDMKAKIVGEGKEAHKVYAETAEWCEERSKNLQYEIKTAKADVESLKATIEEEDATVASLSAKVDELAASIAAAESDLKAATAVRSKEAKVFAAQEAELTEVTDSLQRAIGLIEKEMQKGGASMMQLQSASTVTQALEALVSATAINSADAQRLATLVQSKDSADEADPGAPAAAVYESHSGGILDTLEGLLEKAEGQLDTARKQETSAQHNFAMLKQSLEDEIKVTSANLAKAKKGIAQSTETKATAEGDLEVTTKSLSEDTAALSDLHQTCMSKARDYEAETKSRGEELEALAVAKKAITDNTEGASKLSYGLSQVSFVQLSSGMRLAGYEAAHYVRDLARKVKSPALAQLASRMASATQLGSGDFGKVKGLIADMIERLESEAEADASEKAYCDKELSESNAKKEEKSSEIEKLSTKIDQMTSRSAKLKEEVAGLQKALADLAKAGAEMDKIRTEEATVYKANKADMEQGLKGVKLALKVLRDYYSKDAAHASADGAGSSIIGLLEVVESDFTKGLAEMTAAEESAQASYDAETKENELEKTTKEQDVAYKTKEAKGLDKATAEAKSDLSGVQTELDAVNEYLAELEKKCVAKAETFAERKARFEAEVSGLKEALRILESEAVLLQKSSVRTLRGVSKHGSP